MAKTLADLERLLPHPENGQYRFFENAPENPFDAATMEFRAVNAWWLMEASFLAYSATEEYAREQLLQAGLTEPLMFGFDQAQTTQAMVAHDDRIVIVAFRGTEIDRLADILADAEFLPVFTARGLVHKGFAKALESGRVWEQVQRHLDGVPGTQTVWFTGHSLGAALATLAAHEYKDARGRRHGLYTFGSPRVGDQAFFCHSFGSLPVYRVVNDQDIVPHVPTPPVYGHVGKLIHLRADGSAGQDGFWEELEHRFSELGGVLSVFDVLARRRRLKDFLEDLKRRSCAPVADHAPEIYATKLWNLYVSGG